MALSRCTCTGLHTRSLNWQRLGETKECDRPEQQRKGRESLNGKWTTWNQESLKSILTACLFEAFGRRAFDRVLATRCSPSALQRL